MRPVTMLALTASALALPATASAQDERIVIPGQGEGTITFFDRTDFNGAAITFRSTDARVRIPFIPRSVRVEGPWRVCGSYNFQGQCFTLDRDYRDTQRQLGLLLGVGSIQSLGGGGGGGYPGGGWPGGGWAGPIGGPQLRGHRSIFFAYPEVNGRRIGSCEGFLVPGCAQRTAQQVCARSGFPRLVTYGEDRDRRRTYLVDVLCSR